MLMMGWRGSSNDTQLAAWVTATALDEASAVDDVTAGTSAQSRCFTRPSTITCQVNYLMNCTRRSLTCDASKPNNMQLETYLASIWNALVRKVFARTNAAIPLLSLARLEPRAITSGTMDLLAVSPRKFSRKSEQP